MSLEVFISTYGYAAIAIGTLFEGETILVLAGFATHQGYLKLPWVVFYGFLGTLCGDQLAFYLGRLKGTKVLEKRPYWRSRSEWVFDLMRSHQSLLLLGFRFLYGFRTITPFLLGASRISPMRFLILNILGAFFWAVLIGVSGYLFGHVVELFLGKLKRYELYLFITLAVIGAIIWSVHWFRRHKASVKTDPKKMMYTAFR
ncbi:MAG: DedA family protein [Thermodesulfobacteriota bacterium]|jgi:membrane protein DedA with SNARE-associated domain